MRLYKQQVRPRSEIASAAWSPWLTGNIEGFDIENLERDQESPKNDNRSEGKKHRRSNVRKQV